jgi:hypothetical protein
MDEVLHPVRTLEDDARAWAVPRWFTGAAFLAPIAGGGLLLLLGLVRSALFVRVTAEDGLFEWVTVVGWLLAAVASGLSARTMWQRGWRAASVLYGLLAVGCLAAVGEELSWGQRLLGVETPEPIEERNEQGDLTAHNLAVLHWPYRVGMAGVGLYGSLFAYAIRGKLRSVNADAAMLLLPPFFLSATFLVLMAYRTLRLAWVNEPIVFWWGFGEWPELTLPFAIACFAWLLARRVQRENPTTSATLKEQPRAVAA